MKASWMAAAVAACVTASLLSRSEPAVAAEPEPIGAVISQAIHEGGSFFTASERALITAKCGYKPGEWDGVSMSVNNGVFTCGNGRKVDDPQMRAMLKVAQPRIAARISKVMASPKVQDAISHYASEAARKAIENLGRTAPD
ncbi:MAG TPA: hypothetical protein VD768_03980 [Sphingomicrobium sp.]|nr:hypothetical protein [Sphingomicrobium sp.]